MNLQSANGGVMSDHVSTNPPASAKMNVFTMQNKVSEMQIQIFNFLSFYSLNLKQDPISILVLEYHLQCKTKAPLFILLPQAMDISHIRLCQVATIRSQK